MLAICGAQLGMSMTYVMSDIELMPSASPKSAMPIGNPIAMNDPNATSRMIDRRDQADDLARAGLGLLEREEQVAAHFDLQRRVLPHSAPSSLRSSRSPASSSSITGYWTRISAMRPSGETEPLAAADRPPAATLGRWCRARGGGQRPSPRLRQGPLRLPRIEEGHAVVERRHDHLGGQARSVRLGRREQIDGLLRVEPRHLERILQLAAERRRRR